MMEFDQFSSEVVLSPQPTDAGSSTVNRPAAAASSEGAERGDDARGDLLKAHPCLVVPVAQRYGGHGVAFWDLIQVGGLGLVRAVLTFG
jgi:DNA-directed RNA polymerase sigma subunit (sigma70/sigma32)